MKRALVPFLLAAAGLGIIATATLATQLGLDHNTHWGTGRLFLLSGGVGILGISWLVGDRGGWREAFGIGHVWRTGVCSPKTCRKWLEDLGSWC